MPVPQLDHRSRYLGLVGCGPEITQATGFSSPQAQGKSVMFLVLWDGVRGEDRH